MRKIVTIGREFGSGGREVGKRLAEMLQVSYYDNEIVTELAERTNLSVEYISQLSEGGSKPVHYMPITTGRSFYRPVNQMQVQKLNLSIEQGKLLREIAEKTDCVIVGRCANYILKDMNPLAVFIYADMETKLKRCREKAPEHENMSDKALMQHILNIDKSRAQYYKSVTGKNWDDKTNYEIMINTTYYTIKEAAQLIAQPLFHELG